MDYVALNNGVKMPMLGYGVYQIEEAECEACVSEALEVGYRSIDTAQAYLNERAVGKAIRKSSVPRSELFLTTKIWVSNAGYEKAKLSIEKSLENLQTDYIDLVLIHQASNDYYGTYRALEEYYREGKIRAIGVSNFYGDRLVDLAEFSTVMPAINQIELHPFYQQNDLREIMKDYQIMPEAWSPLAEGKNNLFTHDVLKAIGSNYKKTAAQVTLRYLIQLGVIVIPKTIHRERMIENITIFDFHLTEEEMKQIAQLDTNQTLFMDHHNPMVVKELTKLGKIETMDK
ncbi:aldo-keto reductase [Enterococcus durans IPLA 655]|uniref:aldo/keto reductase n=1 Tax=Enterococcus durans TaxID=53345 RepID=UPI0003287533|nr:aldo/keto reductase [Enterococcus durans]EMS74300.1 aldo-keto reductase [Enterococcus durans IPLA 655]